MNHRLASVLLAATLSATVAGLNAEEAATAPAPAPAPAPEAAPSLSTVLTPAFVSQYMFRGTRLGGPSFQPSVELDYGSWAVGVWTNFPMKDKVVGQSDPEIDPYASYTVTVTDALSIVPGFTWYNYPDADKSAGFYKSTFEPSLAVNYTVAGVKLTPKLYYDVVLQGPTYEFTAAYAVPLKELSTELDFAATAGTFIWKDYAENSDPKTKNWGDYWQVGVTMPFEITKTSKLILGAAYTKGSGNFLKVGTTPKYENSAAVGRGVFSIAYALTF
jgi:uncharacterized protein (TIGR02001 family)